MTPEQFCYWLQGRAELLPGQTPSPEEWKSICEHLGLVFNKVTAPVLPIDDRYISPSREPWRTRDWPFDSTGPTVTY